MLFAGWLICCVEAEKDVSITRLEDGVGANVYSSQNDHINARMRREMARLAGCIRALTEGGVRIDEDMIMRAYEAAVEMEFEGGEAGGSAYVGGATGKRLVEAALVR